MRYFRTSLPSGPVPSSVDPMMAVYGEEFQYSSSRESFVLLSTPSVMGALPGMMVPSVPGVSFPFRGFSEGIVEFPLLKGRRDKEALQDKFRLGMPLPIFASTPDPTPLIPVQKLTLFDQQKYDRLKKNQFFLSTEHPGWTMNPAFIPSSAFSLTSCDVLSEIQRHLLESTIDGGLTWSSLWVKEKIQRYFNERMSRFFLETGVVQEEFSVPVTSGTAQYNYPEDLIWTKRLSFFETPSLLDGLVSFWRLNESSGTIREDSIGPNNLSDTNTVGQAEGIVLESGNFIRASSTALRILDVAQSGLNPGTGDMALSCWIYPTLLTSAATFTVIGKGATGSAPFSAGYGLALRGLSGSATATAFVLFGDNASAFPYCQFHGNYAIPINEWTHLAINFDRDGNIGFYANGTRYFTINDGSGDSMNFFGTNTGNTTPTAAFGLGSANQNGGAAPANFYEGRIDAVGYWNRLLTKEEILALYNDGDGVELYPGAYVQGISNIPLPRVDPFTLDNGSPGWEDETGTPSSITEEPQAPLSFTLAPTPDVDGSVEGIYVADPAPIGDPCTPLPIPNFLCWIIKYGVMADMLNQEGEANDPQRAQYCEGRWQEGISLTRALLGWGSADQGGEQ